jgi:hypothetical protein
MSTLLLAALEGPGAIITGFMLTLSCLFVVLWSLRAIWRGIAHRNPKRTVPAVAGFLFLLIFSTVTVLKEREQWRSDRMIIEKLGHRLSSALSLATRQPLPPPDDSESPRLPGKSKLYSFAQSQGWTDVTLSSQGADYDFMLVSSTGFISVDVSAADGSVSMENVLAAWKKNALATSPEAKLIDKPRVTLDQAEWLVVEAILEAHAAVGRVQCYLATHDGKLFLIGFFSTVSVFEKGLQAAEQVIATFRFEPPSAAPVK